MRRSKELIRLPVLSLVDGRRLAGVKDVLFDPQENRILALLLEEGGAFDSAKVVPFENIKSVGRDAIIVQDETAIIPASADEKIKQARDQGKILTGVSVYTDDGRYLGRIEDMFIDEKTGKVTGYELSGGFLEAAMRGKHFLPAPETMVLGRDVMFVPSATGDKMEEEVTGGVQAAMEETRRRSAEMGRLAAEQFARTRDEMLRSSAERQKEFVVGKVAERNLTAPDGTVIVTAGSVVTKDMADEAERQGVLGALVSAVGTTMARGVAERAGEEAKSAFTQLREAFGGATKASTERAEENRIRGALGRPVTRVILDENDNVILNPGDVVTHAAVNRAREAGVLDVLLDSVSKETPKIEAAPRRTPVTGNEPFEYPESETHIEQ